MTCTTYVVSIDLSNEYGCVQSRPSSIAEADVMLFTYRYIHVCVQHSVTNLGVGPAPSPEYKHKIHNVYLTTLWVTN